MGPAPSTRVRPDGLEAIAQPTKRPLPYWLGGIPWQIEGDGQLVVGKIGEVAQDQSMTVSRSERTEGSPNLVTLRVSLTRLKGRREMSNPREMGRVRRRGCTSGPIGLLAHEDAHEPRFDGGTQCGGLEAVPSRTQSLADLDFGQGLASGHQGCGAEEHGLVPIHQTEECLGIDVLGPLECLGLSHWPPRVRSGSKGLHG